MRTWNGRELTAEGGAVANVGKWRISLGSLGLAAALGGSGCVSPPPPRQGTKSVSVANGPDLFDASTAVLRFETTKAGPPSGPTIPLSRPTAAEGPVSTRVRIRTYLDRHVATASNAAPSAVPPYSPITSPVEPVDTPTIPESAAPYLIDLDTALTLADRENPTIAEARVNVLAALADRQQACALLLPSLNAGTNYHDHTGDYQRSSGKILSVSSQSLYVGGGAFAVGSNFPRVPAVNISTPLTNAIFEPLAMRQRVVVANFNARATANAILLDVSTRFLDLLAAEADLQSRRQSAEEAASLARSVRAYAQTGQGRAADAHRLEAELRLFEVDIRKAEENVGVASARLSERLNLDTSVRLKVAAGPMGPVSLVDTTVPAEQLVATALERRPELMAHSAEIASGEFRTKEERFRPLLPTLWLGFSAGAFGGGSNLVPPSFSAVASRTDFDVQLYWTLLNFGAGNASLIKQRKAQVGQAIAARSVTLNRIRDEVISSRAEAIAQRSVVEVARARVRSAEDGYLQDKTRLRETLALPIEALDSLKLLADARLDLIRAVNRANRAQFSLFVALGAAPPLGSGPPSQPASGPPPVTVPLRSAVVGMSHS